MTLRVENGTGFWEPWHTQKVRQEARVMASRATPGGGGPGRGRGGGGRMGGPKAAGPGGYCLCPKCGHREPHVAGRPCTEQVCPKCGTRMVRE